MTVVFGFSTILLAALSLWLWGSTGLARADLAKTIAAAREQGRQEQLKADQAAALKVAQEPFRSYRAPSGIAKFELRFPKNWSAEVTEDPEGSQPLRLIAHPDFIRAGADDETAHALVVTLLDQRSTSVLKQLNEEEGLKASSVTVSGVAATRYEGVYEEGHNGAIVVIPLREKTLTVAAQDRQYLPQLAEILKQTKLNL